MPLRLKTGRFQDIPIEYRHCLFCDNLVESEIHYILHCPFYNEIRFELFNNVRKTYFYFDLLDDNDKIKRLMEDDIIKGTAIYLSKVFEKRQRSLYI